MKRAFNMILIVGFLIAVCVVEQSFVSRSLEDINNIAKQIQASVQNSKQINTPEILLQCEQLDLTWQYYENALCFFVNHKDMEKLGDEIKKMITYCAINQDEDFKASLCLVLNYSEIFDHFMGLSLQNIF